MPPPESPSCIRSALHASGRTWLRSGRLAVFLKFMQMHLQPEAKAATAPNPRETIAANDPTGGGRLRALQGPAPGVLGHAWFTFNLGSLTEDASGR